jgi:hypothetical protein
MSRSEEPYRNEGESEYLERMLGAPGSEQRRLGDPAAVAYYRNLWRAPKGPTPADLDVRQWPEAATTEQRHALGYEE